MARKRNNLCIDGVKVAYIHPESGDVVVARFDQGTVDFCDAKQIYDALAASFPENKVILVPDWVSIDKMFHRPDNNELAKQILFDCAMELLYHTEKIPDEVLATKMLDALHTLDKEDICL
jgi:hypothetical protein